MHLTSSLVALGSMAAVAAAISREGFEFPASVPMEKRQPSGPQYECHADCGFAIRNAREEGYCEDPEWLELFEGCLNCALEFDIWIHYGDGVGEAAEACGLDATPVPAGGEESSSSAAEVTEASTTTVAEVTSTEVSVVPTTEVSTTLVVSTTTVESSAVSSVPVVTTPSASASVTVPGNGTAAPTSSVPAGAGPQALYSGILAAGAAAMVAAFMM